MHTVCGLVWFIMRIQTVIIRSVWSIPTLFWGASVIQGQPQCPWSYLSYKPKKTQHMNNEMFTLWTNAVVLLILTLIKTNCGFTWKDWKPELRCFCQKSHFSFLFQGRQLLWSVSAQTSIWTFCSSFQQHVSVNVMKSQTGMSLHEYHQQILPIMCQYPYDEVSFQSSPNISCQQQVQYCWQKRIICTFINFSSTIYILQYWLWQHG